MKLVPTRRTDYGLRAMIHLARAPGPRSKAAEIAGGMDIPATFLYQVLGELQRSGLVASQPSRNGGYALARPAEAITILEVVEALEGSLQPGECAIHGGPCRWDDVCALHPTWSAAREALVEILSSTTLADVAAYDRSLDLGVAPVPPSSHRRRPSR